MVVDLPIPTSQTLPSHNYQVKQNCHGFPITEQSAAAGQQVQQLSQWLLNNQFNNQAMFNQFMPQPQVAMVQPVMYQQPIMFQQTQAPWGQVQSLSRSPSPSLSPAPMDICPNLNLGAPTQNLNVPVPNLQYDSSWVIYELPIIRHDATPESITNLYGTEIGDGMRAALNLREEIYYLYISVNIDEDNKMAIQWIVDPSRYSVEALRRRTEVKDFKDHLICHLAGVGGGNFNKHLHGSKQLTIIKKGFEVAQKFGTKLVVSDKDRLNSVLNVKPRDMFDEHKVEQLFHVCDHQEGRALRGPCVVGAHFRGPEVSKQMVGFVEDLLQWGTVQRASMIASMKGKKGKKQYKGWSIYIETPSAGHVEYFVKKYQANSTNVGKKEKANFQIFQAIDRKAQHNQLN